MVTFSKEDKTPVKSPTLGSKVKIPYESGAHLRRRRPKSSESSNRRSHSSKKIVPLRSKKQLSIFSSNSPALVRGESRFRSLSAQPREPQK
jgi:hypothetical protein